MKFRTVLFDFDGTLADTLPICFYAFQQVFRAYDGRDIGKEDIISMFGPSEVGIIKDNLLQKERVDAAIEDYYRYYDQEHRNAVSAATEMIDMVNRLKREGIAVGIVTGKARRSYDISVNYLFPKGMFQAAITGDDVAKPKPDPEGIVKAMSLLDASARETLYVGDSDADIEAGIRANVKTAGVTWLEHSHGKPFSVRPDYEFASVSDLLHAVLDRE